MEGSRRTPGAGTGQEKRCASYICLVYCPQEAREAGPAETAGRRDPPGVAMTTYAPLWCKSNFSFLEGARTPRTGREPRVARAAGAGADRPRRVHGLVRAHVKARELGVALIAGSEVTLDDGSTIVLLAETREGYGRLSTLLTRGRLRSPKGECRVGWREVAEHAAGLIALWAARRAVASPGGPGPRCRS